MRGIKRGSTKIASAGAVALGCFFAVPAMADGPSLITAYANLDLAGADGEQSWLKGDFGKGRFGGNAPFGGGDFRVRPHLAEAGVVLQPTIGYAFGATVSAIAQNGQDHSIDLSEAFLSFRPTPIAGIKLQVRGGLFWPPISLEHTGTEWAVRETSTPSAINSWVGEEVKVAGLEGSASTLIGNHRFTATGALFEDNDTVGTLLTFRGWALHDEKAALLSAQRLPPRNAFMTYAQDDETYPLKSFRGQIGWYAKLAWRPPAPFELQYFHYDNRADPQEVDADLQWGWRTKFDHLGAIIDVDGKTRLTGQAITGTTRMGYVMNGARWIDMRFRSAFLLATRTIGDGSVSARGEAFSTRNRGSVVTTDDSEHGWAMTIAARKPICRFVTALAEGVHIDSRRESRLRLGLDPHQDQNVVRLTLRLRAAS